MAFKYQKREESDLTERATRSSGLYDSMFAEGYTSVSFPAGDHTIRILPPTWKGAKHYGFTHFVHFDVGPDRQRYLCNEKMGKGACPLCDAARTAARKGDDKYAKKLRPSERILVWVIDRSKEREGPKVWSMAWGTDKDIAKLCRDRRTKAVLWIDDPENGFDVDFSVENVTLDNGQRITKPTTFAIARASSPLCDDARLQDDWLDFVEAHPLDRALKFYSEEHILKTFAGAVKETDDRVEDEPPPPETRRRDDRLTGGGRSEEDEDRPEPSSRRRPEPEPEPEPRQRRRPEPEPEPEPRQRRRPEPEPAPPSRRERAAAAARSVDDED